MLENPYENYRKGLNFVRQSNRYPFLTVPRENDQLTTKKN